VQRLLCCSLRLAYDLTEAARDEAEEARDAAIAAGKPAGKSNRQIERETGVPRATIDRVVVVRQICTVQKVTHLDPFTTPEAAVVAEYCDIVSSRGERRWGAFRALQRVCRRISRGADR
jgi:hypothetical protein